MYKNVLAVVLLIYSAFGTGWLDLLDRPTPKPEPTPPPAKILNVDTPSQEVQDRVAIFSEIITDPNDRAKLAIFNYEFAKRVLEGEEELYVVDEKSLGWQVVQLYRTILINMVTIFFTVPFYRLLMLVPILFLFYVHDKYRQPYKDDFLNRLQSLSSGCLLLVLQCNVLASISFMADISKVEFVDKIVSICGMVEIALYAVVPLYLPLSKAWNIYEDRRQRRQKDRND